LVRIRLLIIPSTSLLLPNTACSGRLGVAAFLAFFTASAVFRFRAFFYPAATNAHRWAASATIFSSGKFVVSVGRRAIAILIVGACALFLAACTPITSPLSSSTKAQVTASNTPAQITKAALIQTPLLQASQILQETETSTPKPSSTPSLTPPPSQTPQPTDTSTAVPTLSAHTWNPDPVLVLFDVRGGDGGTLFPLPPRLIVYADGQFFVSQESFIQDEWRLQLLTVQLERKDACALLNTIDQAGFFDYDPSTYIDHISGGGNGEWHIVANAWGTNRVLLYGLGTLVDVNWSELALSGTPVVLPAIRDTYLLLSRYRPSGLQIFQPERVGIWVGSPRQAQSGAVWPLQAPCLAELSAQSTGITDLPV
jgi:hypothetical protein